MERRWRGVQVAQEVVAGLEVWGPQMLAPKEASLHWHRKWEDEGVVVDDVE